MKKEMKNEIKAVNLEELYARQCAFDYLFHTLSSFPVESRVPLWYLANHLIGKELEQSAKAIELVENTRNNTSQ